jgi:hypothetical protein
MRFITIATDLDNVFFRRVLVPSCRAMELELTVLHPQQNRIRFADKRFILMEYLARPASDSDDLIIFTDAYDAMFIRGQKEIGQSYERFAQRVVFSGELNSWPLGAVGFALHDRPPGRYPYLNSGGLIGPAPDLIDLCRRYPEPPSDRFDLLKRLRAHGYDSDQQFGFSDQYYWTLVQHLEPDLVGVDHDAAIFECNTAHIPDVVVREASRESKEFRQRGRETTQYQREYARLQAQLQEPSGAAHLHFASAVTKAVLLDLLDEGRLPTWLSDGLVPHTSIGDVVRVEEV